MHLCMSDNVAFAAALEQLAAARVGGCAKVGMESVVMHVV